MSWLPNKRLSWRHALDHTLRPHRRAFTLIELLVVISIIALLLAILLPVLSSARERGKMIKCLGHMRSMGQELVCFSSAYGRVPLVTDEVGNGLADPNRDIFQYGAGQELLSWPVALAKSSGILSSNQEWGVRAASYQDAKQQEGLITSKTTLGWAICPSDRVGIASAYYPRGDGLRGPGPSSPDTAYWGRLSFAINEDIAGAEVAESGGNPACWRRVDGVGYRGEFSYPPSSGGTSEGQRLQGNLERVFQPSQVGLVFEAGRDDLSPDITGFANLVTSARSAGPYLGDFQQFHNARMPTARHPKGALNILYADTHGGTVYPTKINPANGLPEEYSPRVRVSPYHP
jgi:prepilin-type N-terminal cleavage/methylation domain-containing protein